MPSGRRLPAALLTVLTLLGVVLLGPSPAQAHSELVRSDPPAGGLVAEGRTELSLHFAEGIYPQASTFGLHTIDGDPVDVGVAASADGSDGFVQLETVALERAIYVLDWQVLSREDGHTTGGSLLFGAGIRPDTVSPGVNDWPGWPTLALRWLDLLALTVALGAVTISGRILRRADRVAPGARVRALRIGAAVGFLGVLSASVTPFLRTPRGPGDLGPWVGAVADSLIGTQWGWLWIGHGLGLLLAGVLLLLAARRDGDRARWGAALALLAVAASDATTGHASDLARDSSVATVATTVHVLTAGTWAGSLVLLAVCLLPTMARSPQTRRRLLLGTWRDFSPLAAVSAGLLLASGLYMAGRQVPDLSALRSTLYGLAVGGKTVALVAVLAVAAQTTLVVNPGIGRRIASRLGRPTDWTPVSRGRFPQLVLSELAILALALGLAAMMTSAPSARTRVETSAVSAPRTAAIGGLFVTFEEVPAGAGDSRIIVRASAVTRPQPGPVVAVDVLLVSPDESTSSISLRKIEEGRFEAATPSPTPGEWQAWIALVRPGVPDAVVELGWTVAPSNDDAMTSLERVATALAAPLLLVVGGLLARWLLVRRHSRGRTGPPDPPASASAVDQEAVRVPVRAGAS